jgi:hypothetical protein
MPIENSRSHGEVVRLLFSSYYLWKRLLSTSTTTYGVSVKSRMQTLKPRVFPGNPGERAAVDAA